MFNTPRRPERAPGARAPLPVNPGARLADHRNLTHNVGSTPPVQPGARSQGMAAGVGHQVDHDPNRGMGVVVVLALGLVSTLLFPPLGALWLLVFIALGVGWLVGKVGGPIAYRRGFDAELERLRAEYGDASRVPPAVRARLLAEAGIQDTPKAAREHLLAFRAFSEGPASHVPDVGRWEPSERSVNLDNWKFDLD